MSCYGCGAGFSAFRKEHGCKNCGFAFCTKCLPNKVPVPKLNNEKHRVCIKCYKIMTGQVKPSEDNPAKYSPPENYKKRVAALQEREKSGSTGIAHQTKGHSLKGQDQKVKPAGVSQADWDIQQRLLKLREDKKLPTVNASNENIDDRLANLKGMDPARYKAAQKPKYQAPDRRTQQEQINDLLEEIGSEVELDSHLPDPVTEIEQRLAQLRRPVSDTATTSQDKNTPDRNDLNKTSLRDSQSFNSNIDGGSQDSKPATVTGSTKDKPPEAKADDEISPEEVTRILNETAQTLEEDARKALKGLEEDKEIMKRLQEVKQRRKQSSTDVNRDDALSSSDSDNDAEEEDDEQLKAKIIRQALEEAKLDMAAAKDGINPDEATTDKADKRDGRKKSNLQSPADEKDDDWYDPDELPYCCICTEDATVRCLGCDRDLYCDTCLREGHKELGLTDHATLKYTPPKEKT